MAGEELKSLLQRAKEGDREALGIAFQRLTPFLLQLANEELDPKLRQKTSGSDLVQQTLMEAGQSLATFEGSSDAFLTWLRRILLNNIANQRRHFRTKKRNLDREVHMQGGESSAILRLDTFAHSDPSRSDELCQEEFLADVSTALAGLSSDYQQVIAYRNERKLTFQEIGQLMGRSEDAARKLWARAIEALKAEIDRLDT